MNSGYLTGKLVRLAVADPEETGKLLSRWDQDSTYLRLFNGGAHHLFSPKQAAAWIEKDLDSTESYNFVMRTLAEDLPIGVLGLGGIDWTVGNAYVGIGIGERDYWGRGYGTDALNVLMRHAFHQLNLRRISLCVLDFNDRAIKSYTKVGFQEEGRTQQSCYLAGRRCGIIFMGAFRHEWEAAQLRLE